jgi:L-lactate dehydrogenase complex protein LldE
MTGAPRVTLFIQCLVDALYPEVGESMVRVLQKLGASLSYPTDQTCCGQPAFNAGFRREARVAARRFIEIFEGADLIVSPSGSCVSMVRNHYPELFATEPDLQRRARAVAKKTYEFTEFLVDVLGIEDVGSGFTGKVTYHDSCHLLRGLRVSAQPRRLLNRIPGVELVEMTDPDYCCGFGGTFSITYPDISGAMLEDKIRNIVASGAEAVVGCDMGCLMNIEGMLSRKGLSIKALHIAQILAG